MLMYLYDTIDFMYFHNFLIACHFYCIQYDILVKISGYIVCIHDVFNLLERHQFLPFVQSTCQKKNIARL